MTIQNEIQRLDVGGIVELFELSLEPITKNPLDVYRFHAGTNFNDQPVVWKGLSYQPYPVKVTGFEQRTQGTLPRPTMTAANLQGLLSALCLQYDELAGARVTRRRTLTKFLDPVNFPSRRNLLTDTINLTTSWTISGATRAAGTPLAANTMVNIVETATTSQSVISQTVAYNSGSTYTFSAIVKRLPGAKRHAAMLFGAPAFSPDQMAVFNLDKGTVTKSAAMLNATIMAEGEPGCFRITATVLANADGNGWTRLYVTSDPTTIVSYAGDGTSGLAFGAVQLEIAAKPSAYQPVGATWNANPDADTSQEFPSDTYYIERKVSETPEQIEFELVSIVDLEGFKLPGRPLTQDFCPFEYRGPDCRYVGTAYFAANDTVVSNAAQDVCSKSIKGCKLRFGQTAARLPFGGFMGVRLYQGR